MFLPGDPLLSTALQVDASLFEFAVDQRVIPASPLTLVALLRTVATAWQQQRLAENAEEIQIMGKELYERLSTMAEYVAQVGTALKRAGRRTTTSWARSMHAFWCRRADSATSASAHRGTCPTFPPFISRCVNPVRRNCGSLHRNQRSS